MLVQVAHRSVHKVECERLEQQMKRADILNDFPFSFTREATVQVINDISDFLGVLINPVKILCSGLREYLNFSRYAKDVKLDALS